MELLNLTGKKFSNLKVISLNYIKDGKSFWLCRCDCGKECIKPGVQIKSGHTKSCGCLKNKGGNLRHGHAKFRKESQFYKIWARMLRRCRNKNSEDFSRYGKQGIKVYKRWYEFRNFLKDMYPSFIQHKEKSKGIEKTTIDRIDNHLGYFKENCRWATMKEQAVNRKNTIFILHNGIKMCLKDFSRHVNLPYQKIYRMYRKNILTSFFDISLVN